MSVGTMIDERMVSMGFDNKLFERNVKESMGTLDALKDKLNFSGVANSLNKTMGAVNTATLTSNLGKVKDGFTAMEIVAIATLANITNKVVDLGLQIAKSLSVDNLSEGWNKFGQRTTSVATLMAQTLKDEDGNVLDDASKMELILKNLELLEFYANETSYSFSDMLSNITKFTGAGVSLDDATQAMIGSSNWAALSGQDAATAARAQLQLSQAMGAGAMMLLDWRSIQNANMATQEFKQMAIDTAVEMGTLTQSIDGTYMTMDGLAVSTENFRNTLHTRWFTSDVLLNVLKDYGSAAEKVHDVVKNNDDIVMSADAMELLGDQLGAFEEKAYKAAQESRTLAAALAATKETVASTWTNIFTSIFGPYEEAKDLWTTLAGELNELFVSNLVVKSEIFDEWYKLGGRNDLFQRVEGDNGAFWNFLDAIKQIRDLIKKSWNVIFPLSELEDEDAMILDIAQKLKNLTEKLKEASKGWILSEEAAEIFTNILEGMFSAIKLVAYGIGVLWKALKPFRDLVLGIAKDLLLFISDMSSKFTVFVDGIINPIKKFDETLSNIEAVKTFGKMGATLNYLAANTETVADPMYKLTRIAAGLGAVFQILKSFAVVLAQTFNEYLMPVFSKMFSAGGVLSSFGSKIISWLAKVGDSIVRFKIQLEATNAIQNGMNNIVNFFKKFREAITTSKSIINESESAGLETEKKLNPFVELAKGLGSILLGLTQVVKGLIPVVVDLLTYLGQLMQMVGSKLTNLFGGEGGISIARLFDISFWAFIAWRLSEFTEYFAKIWGTINSAFADLGGAIEGFEYKAKTEALENLAQGLLMIVVALVLLASLDSDAMERAMNGITQIAMVLMMMTGALKLIMGVSGPLSTGSVMAAMSMQFAANAMMTLSTALLLFVGALLILSTISQEKLIDGMMGLILVITTMLSTMKVISANNKGMIKGAVGLVALGLALNLMVIPLKIISKMSYDSIARGVLGLSALVGLAIGLSLASRYVKKANRTATGMIGFSISLSLAAIPLKALSKLSWGQLAVGLAGMYALGGLMIGLSFLSKYTKKAIITAIGMSMLSTSLTLFGLSVASLALISWGGILKAAASLVMLAGIIFGISKFVTPKLALSMGLFGMSLTVLGIGLASFAIALKALGKVNLKDIGLALLAITVVLSWFSLLSGVLGIISPLIVGFSIALTTLSIGLLLFALSLKALGSIKFGNIIKSILILVTVFGGLALTANLLKPLIPTMMGLAVVMFLFGAAVLMLSLGISGLALGITVLARTLGPALAGILSAIIKNLPLLMEAIGLALVIGIQKLIELLPEIEKVINEIIDMLSDILIRNMPTLIKTLNVMLMNLIKMIKDNFPHIAQAIMSMIVDLLAAVKERTREIVTIVIDIFIELLAALRAKIPEFVSAFVETALAFLDAFVAMIVESIPRIVGAMYTLIIGTIDGLGKAIEENAPELNKAILRFIKHILNAFSTVGSDIVSYIRQGLSDGWTNIKKIVQGKIEDIKDSIKEKYESFKNIGKDLIRGLIEGIEEFVENVKDTVEEMASKLPKWVKDILGIKSPSRVFAEIGKQVDQGLMTGIDDNKDMVKSSAEGLGDEAVEGVENSGIDGIMKAVYDMLTSEFDGQIVITPVLDLSEIQNGKNQLYSMLSNVSSDMGISGSKEIALKTSQQMNSKNSPERISQKQSENVNKGEQIVLNNTFNVSGTNAKQIAKEISKEINNSIDRRRAVWAR